MTSWIVKIPDHLKLQEMCDDAVRTESLSLEYVHEHFETQGMCNEAVKNKLRMILFVSDHFWAQKMCNETMRPMPDAFQPIPNPLKRNKCVIRR